MTMNNSLAEVRPELVPERSEKNLPLKPDEITSVQIKKYGGSAQNVWWHMHQKAPEKLNPGEG